MRKYESEFDIAFDTVGHFTFVLWRVDKLGKKFASIQTGINPSNQNA